MGQKLPKLMSEDTQTRVVIVNKPVKDDYGRYIDGVVSCRVDTPIILYRLSATERVSQTRREGQLIKQATELYDGDFKDCMYMMANFWVEEGTEFIEVTEQ